jgi:hypothetical protein
MEMEERARGSFLYIAQLPMTHSIHMNDWYAVARYREMRVMHSHAEYRDAGNAGESKIQFLNFAEQTR